MLSGLVYDQRQHLIFLGCGVLSYQVTDKPQVLSVKAKPKPARMLSNYAPYFPSLLWFTAVSILSPLTVDQFPHPDGLPV